MEHADKPLKVLQVLPALNSGGVERGTVDFARFLVNQGIESLVMSSGGRLVQQLEQEGSTHIPFPIHKKSPLSFLKVPALRRCLLTLNADVIHVRSRMPAWLIWQALKHWLPAKRPVLISTFHGLYSVSFYSAIMGCGDQVIAISECVRDYITGNYPKIDPNKIQVIHRGVDKQQFNPQIQLNPQWCEQFYQQFPHARNKNLILMPGRLSSWKGQEEFIDLMVLLKKNGESVYGLLVGEATPGKESYAAQLRKTVKQRELSEYIGFAGHRDDMAQLYKLAKVVLNLSQHAEPFGRTVIEALAVGTPVVAYNAGGPAESLRACLPDGLVERGDMDELVNKVSAMIASPPSFSLSESFTLPYQASATLDVYYLALANRLE